MSRVLVQDDLKLVTPVVTTLQEFVKVLLEHYSNFNAPPRLMKIFEASSLYIHIYKDLDHHMVKRSVISNSRKMLRDVFVHKERTLINQLFKDIGDKSKVCVISLTNRTDDGHCIVGTSVFAMCEQGCYISYIAVAEKDPWKITENGSFRECGVARFLVYSIQLVAYVNYNCWNLYCWSNNEQGDERNDLWSKLGFAEMYSNNDEYWPRQIEDFAVQFHLPAHHALEAGLVPKGILSPIGNIDNHLDRAPILSLQYYKDAWFDYSLIAEGIADDDRRLSCLKWLKEKIEFGHLPEGGPESTKKFYYIFNRRLEDMLKTIALTGEDEDLKEVSQLEGYMSDIALDYCMMAMFFHVGKIFPIHTQVFNWWNISENYDNLQSNHFVDYEYTDCDIIEEFADDKEFQFVIPCFHGEHFFIIVRRWMNGEIFFFFNDSDYKTERSVNAKSTTSVPVEIYAFLMNSPLWRANVSVNWVRVPSKKQDEEECGFRTLLHAYVLLKSDDPITSLLPLTYIGSNKLKKSHPFSKYKKESLSVMCRQWVKDIMYSKKWQVPVWIDDILQYKETTTKERINSSYYFKICAPADEKASTKNRLSPPTPLHEDQQVVAKESSSDRMQENLMDVVPHLNDDKNVEHEDQHYEVDQSQQSLMDVVPHFNGNRDRYYLDCKVCQSEWLTTVINHLRDIQPGPDDNRWEYEYRGDAMIHTVDVTNMLTLLQHKHHDNTKFIIYPNVVSSGMKSDTPYTESALSFLVNGSSNTRMIVVCHNGAHFWVNVIHYKNNSTKEEKKKLLSSGANEAEYVVTVYDSLMPTHTPASELSHFSLVANTMNMSLSKFCFIYEVTPQQKDVSSCGFFSLLVVEFILDGINPFHAKDAWTCSAVREMVCKHYLKYKNKFNTSFVWFGRDQRTRKVGVNLSGVPKTKDDLSSESVWAPFRPLLNAEQYYDAKSYINVDCISVDDSDDSSDMSEYHGIGDAPWRKGNPTVQNNNCQTVTCTAESHDAAVSVASDSDVEFMDCDSRSTTNKARQRPVVGRRVVVRTQDMAFTRQFDTTDDSHSSSNVNDNLGESLSKVEHVDNEENCLLDVEVAETRRVSLLDVEDDYPFRVIALEEQPPPQVHHLSSKRVRRDRLSDRQICLIETCCLVCNREVKDTIKCVRCSSYIHDVCGFLLSKDSHCCNNCIDNDVDNRVGERKRIRLIPMKDTELSELWSSKTPRISSNNVSSKTPRSSSKLPKVPPVTREQKTVAFNGWLSQVCYMMCKRGKDGNYLYYGCHEDYSFIQEIYSKYVKETLFENEQDLLKQLHSDENLNKWCRLPKLIVQLIRARGECYSNNEKFIAFDKLEQQIWPFIKYNTHDSDQCTEIKQLVDSKDEFVDGAVHISLGDATRQDFVMFVPRYFLYRWHHFCEKHKDPKIGNELSNVLTMAVENPNTWVRVEAGRHRLSSTYSPDARDCNHSPHLPVVYRVQPFGENSCVFSSLISALHYLNDYKMRDMLSEYVLTSLCYKKMTAVSESKSRDAFASKLMNQKGKYMSHLMKNFNIFENCSMWPTLCILQSSDGSLSHAVTVVDNLIFDSTTYRAMEINRENLDWCCGTDYYEAQFVGVYKAYRYIHASASTHILIRKKEDIVKSIRAYICLFTVLYDDAICLELASYERNYQLGADHMMDINRKLKSRPFCYNTIKIKETKFERLLCNCPDVPMVLLLGHRAESYRLITVYDLLFYDGSINSGMPLDEVNLKTVLNWHNVVMKEVTIVRGYMYQPPLKKF